MTASFLKMPPPLKHFLVWAVHGRSDRFHRLRSGVPIVDGNVDRVFARVTGDASHPGAKGRDARRWQQAGVFVAAADLSGSGQRRADGTWGNRVSAQSSSVFDLSARSAMPQLEAGKVSEIPPPKPSPKKEID